MHRAGQQRGPGIAAHHMRQSLSGQGGSAGGGSLDAAETARLTSKNLSLQLPSMLNPPSSSARRLGERTRLVPAGRDPFEHHGFVNTPIYRGSTVLYPP